MERATRQRAAIRAVISQSKRPLLPSEILTSAQLEVPSMSLATVYRNVKALEEEGEIACVMLPGDGARYEANDLEHHHHFRCTSCDRVFDVPGCAGDVIDTVPAGFSVERHELTLYGRCKECSPRGAKAKQANKSAAQTRKTAAKHRH
ncbi:MAG: Fur family transcriptional regulator [Casimicrobium sp.]